MVLDMDNVLTGKAKMNIDDSFYVDLKDGRSCELVCIDTTDELCRLDSRDCMGGYTSSYGLSEYLGDIYKNLPSSLIKALIPVKRKHRDANGVIWEKEEKIFVPAQTEICPEGECYGDKGLYTQIEWYKSLRNRIRAKSGECEHATWYWTSSLDSGHSNGFCGVSCIGGAYWYNAGSNRGVAPFGCYISNH